MRWLAIAGVLALLGLAAFALASTTDELRPRQAAREAGRSVSAQVPESTPPSVATAWTGLIDAIASGTASGGIEEKVSKELAKRAMEVLAAYGTGEAEALGKALESLEGEVAKAVEEDEVSADAAAAIDMAILELFIVLQDSGALVEVPSPSPETTEVMEEDGFGGHGNEGEGGGPPPHANDDKDED